MPIEPNLRDSLLLKADHIRRVLSPTIEVHGITCQQYNVLNILRSADKDGMPTLEVAEQLIEQAPGITRLLDRLEAKGLVQRTRPAADRRQVNCCLTKAGQDLLDVLSPAVDRTTRKVFASLTKTEAESLLNLIEKI